MNLNQAELNLFNILEGYQIPHPAFVRDVTSGGILTLNISSQSMFDDLFGCESNGSFQKRIEAANGTGVTRINVVFDGGTYCYKEKHLQINGITNTNLSIHIIGNGSTLIGSNYRNNQSGTLVRGNSNNGYSLYSGFAAINNIYNCLLIDGDGSAEDFYNPIYAGKGPVQFSSQSLPNEPNQSETIGWESEPNGIYIPACMRIKVDEYDNFLDSLCQDTYVQIYSWFFSQIFKVIRIYGGFIYFSPVVVDGEYEPTFTNHSINKDQPQFINKLNEGFRIGGEKPSYRLINRPFEGKGFYHYGSIFSQSKEPLYLSDATTFLSVLNTNLRSLTIEGLNFSGSAGTTILPSAVNRVLDGIIDIKYVEAEMIRISNCSFRHSKSDILHADNAKNLIFSKNVCSGYYKRCVNAVACENVSICHNTLSNGGLRQTNTPGIVCDSVNYHIAYNKIKNYGYSGIAVGRHYRSNDTSPLPFGVVEYNELWLTPDYKSLAHVPLMDGAAIYAWTLHGNANYTINGNPRTFGTVIRHNFVSGHSGQGKNPGIYADDSAGNVTIYGNMVVNCHNRFGIDLRKESSALDYSDSLRPYMNVNNLMMLNILDGYYRFEGKGNDDTTTRKFTNLLLVSQLDARNYNEINNINPNNLTDDTIIFNCNSEEWGIAVPYNALSQIDTEHLSQFIRNHIRIVKF